MIFFSNNKFLCVYWFSSLLNVDARLGNDGKDINIKNGLLSVDQEFEFGNRRKVSTLSVNNIFEELNESMVSNFSNLMKLNNTSLKNGYIVGGYRVKSRYNYPSIVAIFEIDLWSGNGYYSCAGTLLTPDIVLTAAHCVDDMIPKVVQTGRFSWNDEFGVETFEIAEKYIHPNFIKNFFYNDVALVKLKGRASAKPARLNLGKRSVKVGDVITIIGWGKTSDGGKPSSDLLETKVSVISKEKCKKSYGSIVSSSMFCSHTKGRDACQGDSGGPAFDNSGSYQVGIISFGQGCAEYPGVYTDLSDPGIMKFINLYMCELLSPNSCENGNFKYDKTIFG